MEVLDKFNEVRKIFKSLVQYIDDQQYFVDESAEALIHYSMALIFVVMVNIIISFFVLKIESNRINQTTEKTGSENNCS